MSQEQEQADGNATDRDPVSFGASTPAAEWVMAGVGALIVAALLAVLVHEGLTAHSNTPTFTTRVVSVTAVDDQDVVTVDVTNTGGAAASAIVVTGRVDGGAFPPARARIDHLAPGATATVGLVVPASVHSEQLQVGVSGFRHP